MACWPRCRHDPRRRRWRRHAAGIGFGGSFSSGNNYTAATGETMQGTLRRLAGSERLDVEKGLVLTGGATGAVFSSRSENLVGGTTLTKSFGTETVFTPDATQGPLATVLSVGGNLWARYQDGRFRYGYSSRTGGGWQEHTQSVPAPEAGKPHALSMAYEAQGARHPCERSSTGPSFRRSRPTAVSRPALRAPTSWASATRSTPAPAPVASPAR